MKLKKILSVIIVLVMMASSVSVLTGCNNDQDTKNLGTPDEVSEEYSDYSAKISDSYLEGDKNPALNVTLSNTNAVSGIKTSMLEFSGAFKNLKATDVTANNEKITIKTEGNVIASPSHSGMVTISNKATDSGKIITANADVNTVSIFADTSSYKLEENNLTFNVVSNDKFVKGAAEINKLTSLNGYEVKVKSVSDDKTVAKMEIALKSNSESDIQKLSGGCIDIKGNAFESGKDKSVQINTEPANIIAFADYIGEDGNGTAYLSSKNGSLSKLTKDDVLINGVKVSDIKENNDIYEIDFNVADTKNINNSDIKISVPAEKLTNLWGTKRSGDRITVKLNYSVPNSKGDTFYLMKDFVNTNVDLFKTIESGAGGVSIAQSVGSSILSFLELIGVAENPVSQKLDEIIEQINNVQDSVDKLDQKITNMGIQINQKLDDISLKTDYNNASSNWQSFVNNYLVPFTNDIDNFEKQYNSAGYNLVNDADEGTFVIYMDENENVCYPRSVSSKKKYSAFDNSLITNINEVKLTSGLPSADKAMQDNNEHFNSLVFDAVVNDLHNIYGLDEETGRKALLYNLSYQSINNVGISDVIRDYKNFCNAVAGQTGGLPKTPLVASPVDSYNSMASIYYNFYSEAQEDLEGALSYLLSVLLKGSAVSEIARIYDTGATTEEEDFINSLYSFAHKEILKENIHHKDNGDNSQWSYVAERYIKTHSMQPYIYIHYTGSDEYNRTGGCESFSNAKGHINRSQFEKIIKRAQIISGGKSLVSYFNDLKLGISGDVVCDINGFQNVGANEHELLCQVDWGTGYYFTKNNRYKVGTHKGDKNKHKYESKYYVGHKILTGTVYSLTSNGFYEDMIEAAWYYEMHTLWSNPERAGFVLRNTGGVEWNYGCDDRANFTFFEYV